MKLNNRTININKINLDKQDTLLFMVILILINKLIKFIFTK
jgi:hypothetical protein